MSRYFHITTGLRGCYLPDNAYVVRVDTRRELKSVIANEADNQRAGVEGQMAGLSQRDVAWAAAHAWTMDSAVMPFGFRRLGKPYSIQISKATLHEWRAHQKEG